MAGLLLGAVRASNWMAGNREHEASSRRISEILRTRTSLDRFASPFWCYYASESHVLRCVNAGHLPPLLVRRHAGGELEIERLTEGCPVFGITANGRLAARPMRPSLPATCWFFILMELSKRRMLLASSLMRTASSPQSGRTRAGREILRRVHAFLGKARPQDDLTLSVARFRH